MSPAFHKITIKRKYHMNKYSNSDSFDNILKSLPKEELQFVETILKGVFSDYRTLCPEKLDEYTPIIEPNGMCENRSIIFSQLNPQMTQRDVFEIASKYGDVKKIDMNNISDGKAEITFYDLRSATKMYKHLSNTSFAPFDIVYYNKKIHPPNEGSIVIFNIPPEIKDSELLQIFWKFGDIKEMRPSPNLGQKYIEYFDSRDAFKAKKKMNRTRIFNGPKKIIVDFSLPGGFRIPIKIPESNEKKSQIQIEQSPKKRRLNILIRQNVNDVKAL